MFETLAKVSVDEKQLMMIHDVNIAKMNPETVAKAVILFEYVSLHRTGITNGQIEAIVTTLQANKRKRRLRSLCFERSSKCFKQKVLNQLESLKVSQWYHGEW